MSSDVSSQTLSEFVRAMATACEDAGIQFGSGQGGGTEGEIVIDCSMRIVVGTDPDAQAGATDETDSDGRGDRAVEARPPVPESRGGRSTGPDGQNARRTDSGQRVFECPYDTCQRAFDTPNGLRTHASKAHEGNATGSENRAGETGTQYKDPIALKEVYDPEKSFAEMTDELNTDVSSSTVRRHMIDHGIHEPTSYNTGATPAAGVADREPEDPSSDGSRTTDQGDVADETDQPEREFQGLLDDLEIEARISTADLNRALREASTLRETSRRLNLDQEKTKRLLMEMNLLDAVYGRLVDKEQRDLPGSEIDERIRNSISQMAT